MGSPERRWPLRGKPKIRSFKRALYVGLLISSIIPVFMLGAVSYYAIYYLLDNKTTNSIESTLHQVRINVDRMYSNLNYVSQQLTNNQLQSLFQSESPVERYILNKEVYEHLQLVSFTNPDTGLFYLYMPDTSEIYYQNEAVRVDADLGGKLTSMSSYKGVTLHAPHPSFADSDSLVFSLTRPVNMLAGSRMSIYVETNLDKFQLLLNSKQYGMDVIHVFTDDSGEIVFSEDPALFPLKSKMPSDTFLQDKSQQLIGNFYYFQEHDADQGWHIYSIIRKANFQKEIKRWLISWTAIAVFSLVLCLVVGWLIWRMFYSPIRKLNAEIRRLGDSGLTESAMSRHPIELTQIFEIDLVLKQFDNMRGKIWSLLSDLKHNESEKRHLEVEKLIAQINPHFLYNTLNTVQWLAKTKGQDDIVNLVTVFIRLLKYNLGKDGGFVPLSKEVNSLKDYMSLQSIRYNYEFPIRIHVDPGVLERQVPRFLLQPLIENALYHGQMLDGGAIMLTIEMEGDKHVRIQVEDTGKGMSEDLLNELLQSEIPEQRKVGMGIGLNYVNTMLKVNFGEDARLHVSSSASGTKVFFRIPALTGETEGFHD